MTGTSRDPAAELPTRVETGFGEFSVGPEEILTFPTGLPGFERCRRFVLLSAEDLAPFQCLHALDGPKVSFAVIDPRLVLPAYRAALSAVDCIRLGVPPDDAGTLLWLAVVTPGGGTPAGTPAGAPAGALGAGTPDAVARDAVTRDAVARDAGTSDAGRPGTGTMGGAPDERPHVNLRAPIVINPQTMVGYQLMPSNSVYPLRHPLGGE